MLWCLCILWRFDGVDNEVRRAREMVVDLRERWDRKVGEVKMDRDPGGDVCEGWGRVGVGE